MQTRTSTYPLLRPRGRWRRLRGGVSRAAIRRALAIAAALAMLGATVGAVVWAARRSARPDAASARSAGLAALRDGNHSAARNHFIASTQAAPADRDAGLALARAYLLLGDGAAALGALDRAIAGGVPVTRVHGLRAATLVVQGEADAALGEAAKAPRGDADAQLAAADALAVRGDTQAAVAALERIVAARPADARAWADLGRRRLNLGDVGGAGAAAQRATALDRRDPAALTLAGEVIRSRYGLVASLPWFEAALRRDAYHHPALVEYAATLGDAGRYADSVSAARRALLARPGSPQALYLLAVVAARAGRLDLAATLLDRTGGALDGLPGGLLLSGGIDYAAGRYEQAALKWQALLDRQPMNLAARRLLGAALLRTGDAAGALAVLRPIALRQDADSYSLALAARAFEATGQRGWAGRLLDRAAQGREAAAAPFGQDENSAVLAEAMDQARGDPRAAVSWLRGEVEHGRWPAALAQAQAIAAASPGAPAAQVLAGDVPFAAGRARDAVAAYRRAADLSFSTTVMLRLVEARSLVGDRRGAAETLALYLSQNPASVEARRMLANGQMQAGDPGAAARTLGGLAADLGGRDALLLAQSATALAAAGAAAAALPLARAAYRLSPMSARVCDALGWTLYLNGQGAAARQLLAKAALIAPADPAIRRHLARAAQRVS